jgi:hypothetical protein
MTRHVLCVASGVSLFCLVTSASAQITCQSTRQICQYRSDGITPDTNCPKLPTTLLITDGNTTADVGYYNDGTSCGVDLSTKKPCGNKLGTTLCGYSAGPDPFVDIPAPGGTEYCDPSGELDWDCIDMQFTSVPVAPEFQGAVREHVQGLLPALADRPFMRELLQTAGTWSSLHVKARVAVSVPKNAAGTPATSLAQYEYWEQGDRYHVRSDVDPVLGFVDIPEIAYDGRFYQVVIGSHHPLLSLGTRDNRMVPLVLNDPFLQQFAFMSPNDATRCPGCELRLNDLHEAVAKLPKAQAGVTTPDPLVLVIPGGEIAWGGPERRQTVQHHLQFDRQHRITRITSMTDDRRLVSTSDLSDWSTSGRVDFPRKVVVRRFDSEHGEPFATIVYAVDEVEVNRQLPDSAFRIPRRLFKKIWNADSGHWFRYEDMSTAGLCQK